MKTILILSAFLFAFSFNGLAQGQQMKSSKTSATVGSKNAKDSKKACCDNPGSKECKAKCHKKEGEKACCDNPGSKECKTKCHKKKSKNSNCDY